MRSVYKDHYDNVLRRKLSNGKVLRFNTLIRKKQGWPATKRFNFSISCNKKKKVASCKKPSLRVTNPAPHFFNALEQAAKLQASETGGGIFSQSSQRKGRREDCGG